MIKTIIEDIQKIKSTPKQLREFGLVMGIFFLGLAVLLYFKQRHYIMPGLIGSIFLVLGFSVPLVLLPLQKIWMTIAVIIGFFMSRVIVTVLFFLVLTPISLFSKISGKKFFSPQNGNSYWIPHPKITDKKSYENQY